MQSSEAEFRRILDRFAPLKSLGDADRRVLWESTRVVTANAGRVLVRKGDVLSGAYLLIDGRLRIYAANPTGKEATLYRLWPGQTCLLSLNAVFGGTPYPACVSVESPSARIAILPGEQVRRLFPRTQGMQEIVLAGLTSTVNELLTQLDEVMLLNLRGRILNFLGRNCDFRGRLTTTHQFLADHLGVSREAISRELSELVRDAKITTKRGQIQVLGE